MSLGYRARQLLAQRQTVEPKLPPQPMSALAWGLILSAAGIAIIALTFFGAFAP